MKRQLPAGLMVLLSLGLMTVTMPSGWSQWNFQPGTRIFEKSSGYTADQTAVTGAATELATTLGQMTGTTPTILSGTNTVAGDIQLEVRPPAVPAIVDVRGAELEQYRIEVLNGRLLISAPTGRAVWHGVAAFLHEKGCRWLMPSPKWWVVPSSSTVTFSGVRESRADFAARSIWYAYGTGWFPDGQTWYKKWSANNLLESTANFNTGHSYSNIISRNQAAFDAHPEYYAIDQNGISHSTWPQAARKFHFANAGLRALCATDRQNLLATARLTNPHEFMVSMDPSDGESTDYHADSVALGTTTDRVFSLTNHVAAHLQTIYPNAWVGMYAYGAHRLPPTITLEPNIHVSVAMAFNDSGLTYEQLIQQWGAAAGSIGIREYYGVEEWDWGLPGIRGAKANYHSEMIPFFYDNGAVSLSAETNSNWGAQALGLYVASRLLWDVDTDVPGAVNDFLTAAYGPAASIMVRFHQIFEQPERVSPPLILEMYDILYGAMNAASGNAACYARLVDLVAYMNYVDLLIRYQQTPAGEPKWEALWTLMHYTHRIEYRNVVHTYALARRLCNAAAIDRPELYMFGSPTWRTGTQYTDLEILNIASQRLLVLQGEMTERVTYTRDLVLAEGDTVTETLPREVKFRYSNRFYLEPVTSGTFSFAFNPQAATTRIDGTLIRQRDAAQVGVISVTGTTATHTYVLEEGELYCMEIRSGAVTAAVTIPAGLGAAIEASERYPAWLDMSAGLVYVPEGTQEIRSAGNPRLSLISPSNVRTDLGSGGVQGFNRLAVPASQDRALWTVGNQTRGEIFFLNVPPLVNLNRAHLLLPREALHLTRVAGDVTTETLPATSSFRGSLKMNVSPIASGTFSFTVSPPSGATVSGTMIRESDNQQIGSFSFTASSSVFSTSLVAGELYSLQVNAPTNQATSILIPAGMAAAIQADAEANPWLDYSGGYLYVPESLSQIVCTGNPRLSLLNPANVRIDVLPASNGPDGVARVPVAAGHDDRIWGVHAQTRGNISLRNLPPYVNLNRAWMLLPRSPFAN